MVTFIAFKNLKKRKAYSIIIFSLILIASILLITSLSVFSFANQKMDKTKALLHTPDSIYRFFTKDYNPMYYTWYRNNNHVQEVEVSSSLYFSEAKLGDSRNGNYDFGYIFINPYQEKQKIDEINVIEQKIVELSKGEILLPYVLNQTKNVQIGDNVKITIKDITYHYKVKGFVEDIMFGSSITIVKQIWLSEADYNLILKPLAEDDNLITTLKVIYHPNSQQNIIEEQFETEFSPEILSSLNYSLAKSSTMSVINLILAIMIFFAIFLILIAVMVMRYAILVAIEADYTEIGIMKALGLNANQIYLITILPYLFLSLLGTILSLAVSAIMIPIIGKLLLNSTGLVWDGKLNIIYSILAIFIIMILITCYATLIARKTKKISPVTAIRQGSSPPNFSIVKSFTLTKVKRFPFIFTLALKQMITKYKHYIMLLIVAILLTFPLIFGGALTNLFSDSTKAMEIIGLEPMDLSFSIDKNNNIDQVINELQARGKNNIENIILINQTELQIDKHKIMTFVSADFNELKTANIFKGRNPTQQNEIALTPTLAKTLNKKIGDTLTIKNALNKTENFQIVGIFQSVEYGGETARINISGMKHLDPEFVLNEVYLYLKKGTSVDSVISDLSCNYGSKLNSIVNQQKSMANIFEPINESLQLVVKLLFIISSVIVILVTFLITNIIVFREKKEMGILKAIGFASNQIRRQLVYRLLIISFIGIIIGILFTTLLSGPLFMLLLKQFGIAKITLQFNSSEIIIQALIILMITYLTGWFVTHKIRNIEPYELINE